MRRPPLLSRLIFSRVTLVLAVLVASLSIIAE